MPKHKHKDCAQTRVNLCGELRLKVLNKRAEISEKKGIYYSVENTIISLIRESLNDK